MTRRKRMTWLVMLIVAVVGALSFNHLTSSYTQPNSGRNDPTYSAQEPYMELETGQTPSEWEGSRVELPNDYQEQFLQYVTVSCSNSRIVRQMYVNPIAVDALHSSATVPSGTVLVMETYSAEPDGAGRLTPTRLNNIFIREKRDGWSVNEESGEWRSAWYSPQGSLVSSSQRSCIRCHAMVSDRDYLFTLPALLTATRTGRTQNQETEFGTSVCR